MTSNARKDSQQSQENQDSTPESASLKTPPLETTQQDFIPQEDAKAVEERLRQLGYI